MAQTKKKRRRKSRKKTRRAYTPAVIFVVMLAAVLCAVILLFRIVLAEASTPVVTELPSPEATQTLPPSSLTAACFGMENGYKTYLSDTTAAHLGIDISSHQGYIDWDTVAQTDVDYAIIRAGYRGYLDGTIKIDEYFAYNIETALSYGLDVGVYFFSQALTQEEAIEEANQVLSLIKNYDLAYPVYFDWELVEDPAARTNTISGTELTQCAAAFCSTIEAAGYEAGVYFNLSTAISLYQLYALQDYDFWLAEYQDMPSYPFAIDMWQYSCEGTVAGIGEAVDLNLSFQTLS